MKRSLLPLLLLLIVSALPMSAAEREYKFDTPLSELSVSTGVSVEYTPVSTKTTQVSVTADDDLIDHVKVEAKGSTLSIYINQKTKKNKIINRSKVTVRVSGAPFRSIEASAGSSLNCSVPMKFTKSDVEIEASSGASVRLAGVEAGKVDIESSSAASVTLSWVKGSRLEVDSSSAASVKIGKVTVDRLDAEASSAAGIKIKEGTATTGYLEASSAGSVSTGSVTYGTLHTDKSSAGSISANKDK